MIKNLISSSAPQTTPKTSTQPYVVCDTNFYTDVREGLSSKQKFLSNTYFYDDLGIKLSKQISNHPDYYLSQCEKEIFNVYGEIITSHFLGNHFNLVEFSPSPWGNTMHLIKQLLQTKNSFCYYPINPSGTALSKLKQSITKQEPSCHIKPISSNHFNGLEWLTSNSTDKNIVIFNGSKIGNLNHNQTIEHLDSLRQTLKSGDQLLIGFDLVKDLTILKQAYDLSNQLTQQLHLNLLTRINREFGANFDLDSFSYGVIYNTCNHAMETYLISKEKQLVTIEAFDMDIIFQENETIQTETACKYSIDDIEAYAKASGFSILKHFSDSRQFFVNSLWVAI